MAVWKFTISCSPEVESRTQGSRPRPRTQKNPRPRTAFPRTDTLEAKDTKKSEAKDSLSEDRHSRGQGPRTKAQVLSKKKVFTKIFQAISKKKGLPKFFRRSPQKNVFQKIFTGAPQNFYNSKKMLSSSRGQANFRGLEASRPRPRTWPSRPRPRTSKCVLEDSTSAVHTHSVAIQLQRSVIFRTKRRCCFGLKDINQVADLWQWHDNQIISVKARRLEMPYLSL